VRSSDADGGPDVVCLRPEEDFLRVGAPAPAALAIAYRAVDDPDVEALMRDARAAVLASVGPPLDAGLIAAAANLRLIQFTGAGVDRVDVAAASRRGIAVSNVAGTNATTVAQYVVGTAIALLRRLPEGDAQVRAGRYAEVRPRLLSGGGLRDLSDLAIGIVGLGRIGQAVAAAFLALEPSCTVRYFDPAPGDPGAAMALGATAVELPELLRTSDVVTLHVPLLPDTRGLIGRDELALCKRDAVLVQASRGGVVDEAALAAALAEGRLAGAAVDVYAHEPPEPGGPLLSLPGDAARRLLLSPHIGGVCRQSEQRQFTATWRNVERVLVQGTDPVDVVNTPLVAS
jgi:phosphoglycerate dehydrogenase-like enzyme